MNRSSEQMVLNEQKSVTTVEQDLREIKAFIRTMVNKNNKKDELEKRAKEWKLVALVLDRLFFFIYLLIILVSVFTVFDFVLFGKDGWSSQ